MVFKDSYFRETKRDSCTRVKMKTEALETGAKAATPAKTAREQIEVWRTLGNFLSGDPSFCGISRVARNSEESKREPHDLMEPPGTCCCRELSPVYGMPPAENWHHGLVPGLMPIVLSC